MNKPPIQKNKINKLTGVMKEILKKNWRNKRKFNRIKIKKIKKSK